MNFHPSIRFYLLYNYIIYWNTMLGRRMFREKGEHQESCKHEACSLSTEESLSPQNTPKYNFLNKEKSELCRKFMEFGYCSYQRNCKFAHGSHELKKNNGVNSKYKTKECGAFLTDGYCRFGDRCNFIHRRKDEEEVKSQWSKVVG